MRNEPKPLDATARFVQNSALVAMQAFADNDKTVEVHYVKRNGQESSSTGKVAYFNGKPGFDTGSVTIDTADKGPRTINLHNIIRYRTI